MVTDGNAKAEQDRNKQSTLRTASWWNLFESIRGERKESNLFKKKKKRGKNNVELESVVVFVVHPVCTPALWATPIYALQLNSSDVWTVNGIQLTLDMNKYGEKGGRGKTITGVDNINQMNLTSYTMSFSIIPSVSGEWGMPTVQLDFVTFVLISNTTLRDFLLWRWSILLYVRPTQRETDEGTAVHLIYAVV